MMNTTTDPSVRTIAAPTVRDLPEKDPGAFCYGDTPAEIAADNYRRATFAAVAVRAYGEATSPPDEEPETVLCDLLGDLRHLADSLGLSFDDLADRSLMHYDEEREGRF